MTPKGPGVDPVIDAQQQADRRVSRRDKLGPDPDVRRAIVAAASKIVREQGIRGLNVAGVLDQCELGTRAFYRHFDSKDQLVAAVLLETAASETRRLRRKMTTAATAIDAVVAWIDGRLDLAFDDGVDADLRQVSRDAQNLMFTSPETVQAAFGAMLAPLVEQLQRGLLDGVFNDIDPLTDAEIVHGAVWAVTERHWATRDTLRADVRTRVLRACLRALGVAPPAVAEALATR